MLLYQSNFSPDFICVTETWINAKRPFLHSLKGYTYINRPGPGNVGGVGIFIKKEIQHNIIENMELKLDNCDDLWIELFIAKNFKVTIGTIYRHPRYNYLDFQNKLINSIETLNSNIIINLS